MGDACMLKWHVLVPYSSTGDIRYLELQLSGFPQDENSTDLVGRHGTSVVISEFVLFLFFRILSLIQGWITATNSRCPWPRQFCLIIFEFCDPLAAGLSLSRILENGRPPFSAQADCSIISAWINNSTSSLGLISLWDVSQ